MGDLDTRRQRSTVDAKQLPDIPYETQRNIFALEALKRISLNLWLWELLGLLTSVACVGAILVVLGKYEGQPVPEWRFGLTVNGLISVLAVVAKASMILPIAEAISQLKWHWYWSRERPVLDFERFDSASRGPWGSLMLLCSPRSWNLAALGAALTLAAIVLEPSLQQIPTYPLSRVISPDKSYTSRAVYFDDVDKDGNGNTMVSSQVRGAVYAAMFDSVPTTTQSISPTCSTGNCTWPSFKSLGMCNTCRNITSHITKSIEYNGYPAWDLPNRLGLTGGLSNGGFAWMLTGPYKSVVFNQSWASQSVLDLSYLYLPPVTFDSNHTEANAYECVLYACVKTYEAHMEAGLYKETVTETWPEPNITEPATADLGDMFACIGKGPTVHYNADTRCNFPTTGNYTLSPPGTSESFSFTVETYNFLRYWMGSRLAFSYSSGFNTQGGMDPIYNDVAQAFYTAQLNGSFTSNQTKVWDMLSPGVVMDTIALSLTNHMRSISDNTTAALGTAITIRNIVHVRWWWATFAVVLLSLTTAFLLSTIVCTLKKGVPVWKSSSLAALLHGLDDSSTAVMTASRFDHVEEKAKSFNMSLRLDGDFWRMQGIR